jgi:formamidopyrimidine-DNA glycosylase
MPELPEVETVCRRLRPMLVGKRFDRLAFNSGLIVSKPDERLFARVAGLKLSSIDRVGKFMFFRFESRSDSRSRSNAGSPKSRTERRQDAGEARDEKLLIDRSIRIHIHLGMTGKLYPAHPDDVRPKHLHVVFHWIDDSAGRSKNQTAPPLELRFEDPRRFGAVELLEPSRYAADFGSKRLGPDGLSLTDHAAVASVAARLKRTRRTIKAALLDQTLVAGVGNIYADEILFRSGVRPRRRADRLTSTERAAVIAEIPIVLAEAIEYQGTTIRDYVTADRTPGDFQNRLYAYGRDGEPCRRCGATIKLDRASLKGRATCYCPVCQR